MGWHPWLGAALAGNPLSRSIHRSPALRAIDNKFAFCHTTENDRRQLTNDRNPQVIVFESIELNVLCN
jgi:hypothetical protein